MIKIAVLCSLIYSKVNSLNAVGLTAGINNTGLHCKAPFKKKKENIVKNQMLWKVVRHCLRKQTKMSWLWDQGS